LFAEELAYILNQKRNFTSLNIDLLWDFPCMIKRANSLEISGSTAIKFSEICPYSLKGTV